MVHKPPPDWRFLDFGLKGRNSVAQGKRSAALGHGHPKML
jgi:hypothetical protein